MRHSLIAIAICLSLLAARPSDANTIEVNFTGTVNLVSSTQAGFPFDSSDTMSGFYTFESTAPDSNPAATDGIYVLTGYTITIGSYTAVGFLSDLTVRNPDSLNRDAYQVTAYSMSGPFLGTLAPQNSQLNLNDPTGTAFTSDALPLTPPSLSLFATKEWVLNFYEPTTFEHFGVVEGPITSLTLDVASVPDAGSTMWLFGFAVAGVAAMGRRLQSKRQ